MAGWLAVCSLDGSPIDRVKWGDALRLVTSDEVVIEQRSSGSDGRVMQAAWRRTSCEFQHSGRIHEQPNGTAIAWVGQCVEDSGDASAAAIVRLAELAARQGPDRSPLARLNGPFAAAAICPDERQLLVAVDRHRQYPVYIHRTNRLAVVTTDILLLRPWLNHPALNFRAVNLFLRCGELIDDMTLLEGVTVIPSGSLTVIAGEQLRQSRYWSLRHRPNPALRFKSVATELGELLRNAVQRVEKATDRLGITLSGGLDSRFLLGLCRHPESIPSFTWGLPDCRDILCASKFAAFVRSPHHIRHWVPEQFPGLWASGVRATGGAMGIDSMYMLPYGRLLAEHCDVVLNGLAGDAILGGNFLTHRWLRETNPERLARKSWRWRVSQEVDRQVDRLIANSDGDGGEDCWIQSIKADAREQPTLRLNDWLYENRVFRSTNCGTMLQRMQVESHAPFFDRDFLDLLLQVPLEMRLKHRLYLRTMASSCQAAGKIPWQRTAIPPRWGFLANLTSMGFHRAWRRLNAAFGRNAFPRLPVADPAGWIRQGWRRPIESLLFSKASLTRGVVSPSGLREVWDRHCQGEDFTRTIGALVTIELLAKIMIDGEDPTTALPAA